MSGQAPPSKDDPNHNNNDDNPSPRFPAAGRSNHTTPSSSARSTAQRRNLLHHILTRQGSQAFEAVARQPGMPERVDYPSHEAWLQALLTASLRQSDESHTLFGHIHRDEGNNDIDEDTNNESSSGNEYKEDSKQEE